MDKGFGETQIELLHQYGIENPRSGLRANVKGIAFGGSIEVRDPATKQLERKEMKPFMVENVRFMLERGLLAFPAFDDMMYRQMTHYIVTQTSIYGIPRFAMSSSDIPDHAHDSLLLACLAYKEHYDELMQVKASGLAIAMSNEKMLGLEDPETSRSDRTRITRSMAVSMGGRSGRRSIRRSNIARKR